MTDQAKSVLEKILNSLGLDATVDEVTFDDGHMLEIKTEDSGRLIGRKGKTLSDLQY